MTQPYNPPSADDWLTGGAAKSATFHNIGDTVRGRVVGKPTMQQQRDFTTKKPKFWDDGNPMWQLVVILQTDERDPQDPEDDGRRGLYIKGQMRTAVQEALRKVGAKALEDGGELWVTYTANGTPPQRGMNPPKLFDAGYAPPVAGPAADDPWSAGAPQQAAPGYGGYAPPPAQQQAPGYGGPPPQQAQGDPVSLYLRSFGVPPEQIPADPAQRLAKAQQFGYKG